MGLDAILKRYFAVVVCVLIGIAAYFQASGMGQLVAASVAVDPSAVASGGPPPRRLPPAPPTNPDHATSAAAILARNPFDSVTGPLDGTSMEVPGGPGGAPEPVNTDPMQDPPCDVAKVLLITESEDPAWSFAAIQGGDGKTMLRRLGDDVGGHTVYFISWDRVWLTQGGTRCQMEVGGKVQPKAVAKAAAPPSADKGKAAAGGSGVAKEISAKIHKVSDTQFDIERSVVDQILENQAELMKSARIVPEKEGDKMVGIRLFGIRQDSVLGVLGLENGDRLQSINGFEMTDPQKALEAYARLRTADHLTVAVNRRGKDTNIDFNIK
jgi:general secretion pathway protein C